MQRPTLRRRLVITAALAAATIGGGAGLAYAASSDPGPRTGYAVVVDDTAGPRTPPTPCPYHDRSDQ